MKKIILIFCLLIISSTIIELNAQTSEIDSLENLLLKNQNKDTIRVNLLLETSNSIKWYDIDKATEYATQAKEIAEKINFYKGKAKSLYLIGIIHAIQAEYTEALEYFEKAIIVYTKIGNKRGISDNLNNIGRINNIQGNTSQALENFQKSIKINTEIENKDGLISNYNNIGSLYHDQGNYFKALEYYLKSLKICEKTGNNKQKASMLNNIGIIYNDKGEYSHALEYYQKALKIHHENNDIRNEISTMINIGTIYYDKGNFSQALKIFQKTLKMNIEIDDNYGIATSYQNIGTTQIHQNKFQQALENIQKSLEISLKIDDKYSIVLSYFSIANIYYHTNKFNLAINYLLKSQEIANELKYVSQQKEIFLLLSKIYSKTNNYKKAFENHKLYKELYDSMFNAENIEKITNLKNQYEFDKEKQTIELEQQKKDAITKKDAKLQKIIRNSFIGGFVLMFLLIGVVFIALLHKRKTVRILAQQKLKIEKSNEKLHVQKEEIQTQAEELRTTNAKLNELSKFKTDTTSMLVHDIKNPLNTILQISDNKKVTQAGFVIENIITNILEVRKAKENKLNLYINTHSLYKIIKTAIIKVELLIENKNLSIIENYNKDIYLKVDFDLTVRIFENLLTNAIKFSPLNNNIQINANKIENNYIHISVKDNGKGVDKNFLNSIFDPYSQLYVEKSGNMGSSGLGLTFCKIAIEAHSGKINIESDTNKGFKVIFSLPYSDKLTTNNIVELQTDNKIELTTQEKNRLSVVINQLKTKDIYEASTILKLLENINFEDSKNIEIWVKKIKQAIFNTNNKQFQNLLKNETT